MESEFEWRVESGELHNERKEVDANDVHSFRTCVPIGFNVWNTLFRTAPNSMTLIPFFTRIKTPLISHSYHILAFAAMILKK